MPLAGPLCSHARCPVLHKLRAPCCTRCAQPCPVLHTLCASRAQNSGMTEASLGRPLPVPTVDILTDHLLQWEDTVLIPLTAVTAAASVVGGTFLIVFCARALRHAPAAASKSAKAARTVQFVLLSQGIADVSAPGFEHVFCHCPCVQ